MHSSAGSLTSLRSGLLLLAAAVPLSVFAQAPAVPSPSPASQLAPAANPGQSQLKQALAAARSLVATHPDDPSARLQYSAALLDAGIGDQAQAEARLATTLDPKSAAAFGQLARASEHNIIAVHFGNGFDRQGAIAAFRTAEQLAPQDPSYIAGLAELYEYDSLGERYGPGASLPDAIREYSKLKAVDAAAFARYQDQLLYAMLQNRQFDAVIAALAPLPPNADRNILAIAALGASSSVAAARERASRIADLPQRLSALRLAGAQLMRLGFYARSADLLDDSIQGPQDAAVTAQVQVLRYLQHPRDSTFPPADPRHPVELLLTSLVNSSTASNIPEILARHAYATPAEWKQALERNEITNTIQFIAQRNQLSINVTRDFLLSNATVTTDGDDTRGYTALLTTIGFPRQAFFVSREDGKYKIVGDPGSSAEIGNYVLYLIGANRAVEARALLDWKRGLTNAAAGDDPLAGDLFARLWPLRTDPAAPPTGPDSDLAPLQIAALALTLAKPASQAPLAPALAAYAKAPDNLNLIQLLASACLNRNDPTSAKPFLDKLLAKYPDSLTTVFLMGQFFQLTHDNNAWFQFLAARLAKHPSDGNLLRQSTLQAESAGDFPRARAIAQQILDLTKPDLAKPDPANPEAPQPSFIDLNNFAWLALFPAQPPPSIEPKSIQAAEQAVAITHRSLFGTLHTLACLQAARGNTAEARQLLLEAMSAGTFVQPNSAAWFGFGSIYQQLGAEDAAIAAYKRVAKPDALPLDPTDVWVLAQARLSALHAN